MPCRYGIYIYIYIGHGIPIVYPFEAVRDLANFPIMSTDINMYIIPKLSQCCI